MQSICITNCYNKTKIIKNPLTTKINHTSLKINTWKTVHNRTVRNQIVYIKQYLDKKST